MGVATKPQLRKKSNICIKFVPPPISSWDSDRECVSRVGAKTACVCRLGMFTRQIFDIFCDTNVQRGMQMHIAALCILLVHHSPWSCPIVF